MEVEPNTLSRLQGAVFLIAIGSVTTRMGATLAASILRLEVELGKDC